MTYITNPLNKYDTYTYNIKISMVRPNDIFGEEVFIAENSTDASLNINSVTHTLVLGHSLVRSSYANTFDIVINEPNNVSFFERIVSASRSLRIKNHVNATYKIEISFPARDSNSKPVRYPSTPFIYFVKIVDLVANITERGSEYTIKAVETNSKGYSYTNGVIKSTLTYKASTVGEALQEFTRKLNESQKIINDTDVNSLKPTEYEVVLDNSTQDWGNWPIEIEEKTPNREGDKLLFHVTQGSSIIDHIDEIFKTTENGKKIPKLSGGYARKELNEDISTENAVGAKYGYKIIPTVEEKEFDPLSGDYVKKITYTIKKHIIPDMLLDSNEIAESIKDTQNQARILKELFDNDLLRKKYDYIFTGNNTEVLNFDMKLQYSYFLISPIFSGQISDSRLRNTRELSEKVESLRDKKSRFVQARNQTLFEFNDRGGIGPTADVYLDRRDDFTRSYEELWEQVNDSSALPMYKPDVIDNAYTYASDDEQQALSLARYGGVKANIENSADLMEIELSIRGDPYWLGNPTSSQFPENVNENAPYSLGGTLFFLNVKLPRPEDNSGLRKPSSEYYISGVYRVINVISEFRNGQFIQYLKAVRMPTILTNKVSDKLEKGRV